MGVIEFLFFVAFTLPAVYWIIYGFVWMIGRAFRDGKDGM